MYSRARPLLHSYMIRPVGVDFWLTNDDYLQYSPFIPIELPVSVLLISAAIVPVELPVWISDLVIAIQRGRGRGYDGLWTGPLQISSCNILPLIWSGHAWHTSLKQHQRMVRARIMTPSDRQPSRGAYQRRHVSGVHRTSCYMGISGEIRA